MVYIVPVEYEQSGSHWGTKEKLLKGYRNYDAEEQTRDKPSVWKMRKTGDVRINERNPKQIRTDERKCNEWQIYRRIKAGTPRLAAVSVRAGTNAPTVRRKRFRHYSIAFPK